MTDTPNKIEEIRAALEGATPGSWGLGPRDAGTEERYVEGPHYSICLCHHHCVGSIEKEMEANARLIALAPDMARIVLAAEKLAEEVEKYVHIQCDTDEMERACIAYHKAVEGEE